MTAPTRIERASAPRRRGAVGVVMVRCRLLVIRRSARVIAPRAFCFPGGGIEAGEGEEAALVRELNEELGVDARPIRCLWRSVTSSDVEIAWWKASIPRNQTIKPNPAEVESVHWYTPDELMLLEGLLSSNADFLRAVARGEIGLD